MKPGLMGRNEMYRRHPRLYNMLLSNCLGISVGGLRASRKNEASGCERGRLRLDP
jgi:hypothetical protein